MEYIIDKNIRVSNHSWGWGGVGSRQSLYDVIEASQAIGHIFIASAGNDSVDTDVAPHYPASYDLPNIIAVAATDNQDNLGVFPSGETSNFGVTTVDLGAPGVYVYSTELGSGYRVASGTSMAAPHVAGVVALAMSRYPQESWRSVKYRIFSSVRPVDALSSITVTGGVVDALRALDCNANGVADDVDIADGTSVDCTENGLPDECEPDCNENTVADSCDILVGTSDDCTLDEIPDECQTLPDCNADGSADFNDLCTAASSDCNDNEIPDECDVNDGTSDDCNGNGHPDECDIAEGTSGDCTGDGIPDECDPDCNENGTPDSCDIHTGNSLDCNGNGIPDECDVGTGDWTDANGNGILDSCEAPLLFVDVDATGANDGMTWISAFTDLGDALGIAASPSPVVTEIWVAAGTYRPAGPSGNREATFRLGSGVGVYGGFAGGETERGQRDPTANLTVLSGDLNGDDGPYPTNYAENSYSVVIAESVGDGTVLDGFTITGGHADDLSDVRHCTGAGLRNVDSAVTVSECIFIDNHAASSGGAMSNRGDSHVSLRNCRFVNNSGNYGGAMSDDHSEIEMISCALVQNSASVGGGINLGLGSYVTLTNCTFSGNTANGGAGLRVNSSEPGSTNLTNCIFWGNAGVGTTEQQQIYNINDEGMPTVSYSCIQGLDVYAGNGNIGDDPQFMGDGLHLSSDSPCLNSGDPAFVPDPLATDIDGEARVMDGRVEMGADEIALDCNGNGIPDAVDIADGTSEDCNGNYIPDECDLAERRSEDCQPNGVPDECEVPPIDPTAPDCNANGTPDECEADCQPNGLPDECDIASGVSMDCHLDGLPDECNIATGLSEDANGNGIPDECERMAGPEPGGPACAGPEDCMGAYAGADCVIHDSATGAGTCYIPKNRYVTIDPTTNLGLTAYQVEIVEAADYPLAVGRTWWLDSPACYDYPNGNPMLPAPTTCAGPDRFGWVSKLATAPVTRIWTETPLHITGCGIVPHVFYEIRTSPDHGNWFSDPLPINTAHDPEGESQSWGDITGGPVPDLPGLWLPPDRATTFSDVGSAIRTFENRLEDTGFPPRVWVDMELDQVINLSDVSFIVMAFEGRAYADIGLPQIGVDPADCP